MQALVHHFAAEQVHEDRHRAEEDREPQGEDLKRTGEHHKVAAARATLITRGHRQYVQAENHQLHGAEQVDDDRAPRQQVLPQFQPEDAGDLRTP